MSLDRFFLFRKKFNLQGVDNRVRNLILQGKDVVQIAVVTFGPDVTVVGTVNQLRGDPDATGRFAHAPFQDMADVELTGHPANIHRLAFESKCGISRNDMQC